jgi:hypothetical protein
MMMIYLNSNTIVAFYDIHERKREVVREGLIALTPEIDYVQYGS